MLSEGVVRIYTRTSSTSTYSSSMYTEHYNQWREASNETEIYGMIHWTEETAKSFAQRGAPTKPKSDTMNSAFYSQLHQEGMPARSHASVTAEAYQSIPQAPHSDWEVATS
jgi:hypothetical protein